jgi:hypothetical protein
VDVDVRRDVVRIVGAQGFELVVHRVAGANGGGNIEVDLPDGRAGTRPLPRS